MLVNIGGVSRRAISQEARLWACSCEVGCLGNLLSRGREKASVKVGAELVMR